MTDDNNLNTDVDKSSTTTTNTTTNNDAINDINTNKSNDDMDKKSTTTTNTTSSNDAINDNTNNLNTGVNRNSSSTTSTTTSDNAKIQAIRDAKSKKIVYYILGILEALFAFRLIFKILGANPDSIFVSVIYNVTHVFLYPFEAIFHSASTAGIETKAVLEPSTIIGMIVYALIAFAIVKLIYINKDSKNN